MKLVKYSILLLIALVVLDWSAPSRAMAKSAIPAACSKIKHEMVNACSKRHKSCEQRSNALNQCLKKSAFRPIAKVTPPKGVVCAMIYQPVCALTAKGFLEKFGNSCLANSVGATEVPLDQCETK